MTTDHLGNILQGNRIELCWIVNWGLVVITGQKFHRAKLLYQIVPHNSPFSSLCSSSFSTGSQLERGDSQKSQTVRKSMRDARDIGGQTSQRETVLSKGIASSQ